MNFFWGIEMGWLDLGFTLLAMVLSFGCCSGDTDQRDGEFC